MEHAVIGTCRRNVDHPPESAGTAGVYRKVGEDGDPGTGAARGTKVSRIELSPEAATNMVYGSLDEQMKALVARIERKGDPLYSADPKVRKRLKAVWERDYNEMKNMLSKADAVSVSHVTINKNSFLPD